MNYSFEYLDIILLAMIAGFIILRLRNILGRKTGHQDKVYSEFAEKKFGQFKQTEEAEIKKPPIEFDTNEKKQCVAGLAGHYKIDELESKLVVVVTNLEIKKMFGLESQVMLLAAVNNSQVSLLHPGKELPTGTIIM